MVVIVSRNGVVLRSPARDLARKGNPWCVSALWDSARSFGARTPAAIRTPGKLGMTSRGVVCCDGALDGGP